MRRRGTVVAVLGTAQTLSWASSYYLPAVLAGPMAHDLGVGAPTIYAAFSGALAGAAVVGPWAGRAIDRGRPVLAVTNLVFAAALLLLGLAPTPAAMVAAWLLMGLAMGSGLYEAAFATLVRLYRHESRNPITGITLIAGFASTVGWPLSAWMETRFGWRGACFGWAALHLLLGLPLNLWLARSAPAQPALPAAPAGPPAAPPVDAAAPPAPTGLFVLLAFVFAATMFVSTAMAAHLPALLQAAGASLAAAVAAGALVGPAQ
ncbi:MAG: MFS transporter, partial [Burkholderiales bacterium]|nr:MFS transporter [Burkholderiales bacterium]